MDEQASLIQRLERVEAQLAIQQLPPRYAVAVDSRDLDALVELFVPDVDCGRWGRGREALKRFYEPTLRDFYRCQHQICGHVVDLLGPDQARGTTYCRAEHEDRDRWYVMAICYFDEYRRVDGRWCFERRTERHWYSADHLERPNDRAGEGAGFQRWPRFTKERHQPALPQHWPSWGAYWDRAGADAVAAVTAKP
jgi:uncharacterized protein (TIGR02246 family)